MSSHEAARARAGALSESALFLSRFAAKSFQLSANTLRASTSEGLLFHVTLPPRFFAWPFTFPLASISTNFIQAAPLTFWSCPRRSDIPTSCLKHDHDARIHLATSFGALRHADRSQGPQKQRCTREPPPPPRRRIAARTRPSRRAGVKTSLFSTEPSDAGNRGCSDQQQDRQSSGRVSC